ncbi:macrophage mannose receptor 1-like [Pocillopora verrucosa]|uniref:macrophage mannose receptor 1-like n=1 Tax=Pocillopora verrucosa TaxID=203993 RepID=UPI00333FA5A2
MILTLHLFKALIVCVPFVLVICEARNISESAPDICPPGWMRWNNACYYFANDSVSSRVTWQDARQACQRIRGGDLASIHSAAENDFITRHVSGICWIGLNDLRAEGNFQWSDGSSFVYKNYSNNEPNDIHGQEDCIEINWWSNGWNDLNCGRTLCYVCKQTKDAIIPESNVNSWALEPTLGRCEDGWVNYEKSCYRSVSDPLLSWQKARDVCREGNNTSMHGDLVTVDNQQEQAFLNTVVRENSTNFWIGFNDLIWEGTFFWTDNSPIRYTNWNVNELSKNNPSMDCVLMNPHKDEGRWRTASCSQRYGFICEADALPILTTLPPYDRLPGELFLYVVHLTLPTMI